MVDTTAIVVLVLLVMALGVNFSFVVLSKNCISRCVFNGLCFLVASVVLLIVFVVVVAVVVCGFLLALNI